MSPKPVIDAGDRLSSLPDEIISHILSFLETKYAVGTAVLGRRWEGLWTMVSNLDLDDRLICGTRDVPDPDLDVLKRYLQFSRFADEVMSQHKNFNSLTRFRFRFSVEGRFWWVGSDYRFKRELVFGPPIEEILLGKRNWEFQRASTLPRI
ncbi:unnamed protein product [Linum tenue]|uniref:F-box domain-containing protein n=1 Tax=Linum tenue TaxID=586396 RepID=A0AAV0LZQ1_9ROSI|nr:unnamed protein product [Linum tenue]